MSKMMTRRPFAASVLVAACGGIASANQQAIELSYTDSETGAGIGHVVASGTTGFNGLDINTQIGASFLHGMGYTGSRAVQASIEAGHIWNGHESLGHVSNFLNAVPTPGSDIGEFDQHATWVGHAMGGRFLGQPNAAGPSYAVGVAPDADLWSGAVASAWNSFLGFNFTYDSYITPYETAMRTGVNGRKADVINSSWGASSITNNAWSFAWYIDALAYENGTTVTFSAGNDGPGANTVGAPAAGYNTIAVASLGPESLGYDTVSNFSSRGPTDVFDPFAGAVVGQRAAVDIAAPGEGLTLAFYGGVSGGREAAGGTASPGNTLYSTGVSGTSFAAPTVAGGASLLVDVAYDQFGGGTSVDGRVVKAILLNGADKIPGWNNGQAFDGGLGAILTTQALDYTSGAGAMNLQSSYFNLVSGTTDVAGLGGGNVDAIGWDYGQVTSSGPSIYTIAPELQGGTTFTATLTWYQETAFDRPTGDITAFNLDNLDLFIYQVDGSTRDLVATSQTLYNATEHLSFVLPETGFYEIEVVLAGNVFGSFFDIDPTFNVDFNSELFGLAWTATATPAPGTLVLSVLGLTAASRRRRSA